jgi:HEAT repeat protein
VVAKSPAAPAVFSELLQSNDIGKDDKISLLQTLSENTVLAPSEVRSGVVSAVNPLLDSADPDLEIAAIRTLGKVGSGKAVAEMLLPKLESNNSPLVREEALNAYALHCNPKNYKPALDMIWDGEENIRKSALTLCQPFLTESDRAVLEEALNHEDEFIRKHVEKILLDQFS